MCGAGAAAVRQRVLGLFERRGLLSSETVGVMQGSGRRGGFSVHAGERVAAQDSAGRERLLRYCARPMFAAERLVWAGDGAQVRYWLPWAVLQGHRVGQQRPLELRLSASEFLDRIALLVPPPRKHRHHYFGVLAPNSPWRALVTASGWAEAGGGEQAPAAKGSGCRQRRSAGWTPGAIFVGTVAGAHLRGGSAQMQRVRRAGAPGWVHHRAGDGAAYTGTCRRASKCTGNRTSALTTGGGECTATDGSRSGRGNP